MRKSRSVRMICGVGLLLLAQAVVAKDWVIYKRNGETVEGYNITAGLDGTLAIQLEQGRTVVTKVRPNEYVKVKSPKPNEVKVLEALYAKGDFDRLISAMEQAKLLDRPQFRYLGWADDIAYYYGKALLKKNEPKKAEDVFEEGLRFTKDKAERTKLVQGTIESYLAQGEIDKAKTAISGLDKRDPQTAAYAFNTMGRAFEAEGKKRQAVLEFLKVILIYKDAGDIRKNSYQHVVALLKEMKDNRAADFEKEMRAQYP